MARYYLSMTLSDSEGRRKKMVVETEDFGVTLTEAIAGAASVVAELDPITELKLERVDWIIKGITAGFAGEDVSNIDVGATFVGELYNHDGARASEKVPGFPQAKTQGDGTISVAEADVEDWLELFLQDGGVLKLSDGEQIDHWINGRLDK
jgi:hypothetical protein